MATKDVSGFASVEISGGTPLKKGEQTITVSYGRLSATEMITVNECSLGVEDAAEWAIGNVWTDKKIKVSFVREKAKDVTAEADVSLGFAKYAVSKDENGKYQKGDFIGYETVGERYAELFAELAGAKDDTTRASIAGQLGIETVAVGSTNECKVLAWNNGKWTLGKMTETVSSDNGDEEQPVQFLKVFNDDSSGVCFMEFADVAEYKRNGVPFRSGAEFSVEHVGLVVNENHSFQARDAWTYEGLEVFLAPDMKTNLVGSCEIRVDDIMVTESYVLCEGFHTIRATYLLNGYPIEGSVEIEVAVPEEGYDDSLEENVGSDGYTTGSEYDPDAPWNDHDNYYVVLQQKRTLGKLAFVDVMGKPRTVSIEECNDNGTGTYSLAAEFAFIKKTTKEKCGSIKLYAYDAGCLYTPTSDSVSDKTLEDGYIEHMHVCEGTFSYNQSGFTEGNYSLDGSTTQSWTKASGKGPSSKDVLNRYIPAKGEEKISDFFSNHISTRMVFHEIVKGSTS